MKDYMIIAKVNDIDYLTKISAESEYQAEHLILDKGVCGKHTYGVTNCMAYTSETMKYDTFRYNALSANPISLEALMEIIEKRNAEIIEAGRLEDRVREIKREMKRLQDELDNIYAAAPTEYIKDIYFNK